MNLIWMYITYFVMVAVNAFANILPLNGVTTGEVSNRYQTLFTPAGYVFSIWGLIYLLLFVWLVGVTVKREHVTSQLAFVFTSSSLLNALWIFMWHFNLIFLSIVVMLLLLLSLLLFYAYQKQISKRRLWRVPISVYLGWIFVATIANICYYFNVLGLVSFQSGATIILLLLASFFVLVFRYKQNDFIVPLVFVWAFIGIFIRDYALAPFVAYTALIMAIMIFMLNWFRLKQYK
ncbi:MULTISPECIES: tryptophan-rich sensory protein [Listeria]|uniref:tryptophan-rich sensory protein n=1 Tax=Listeria TaxID=1637 RepID=UPI000B58783D|nr:MULTISPECIES: tryptophan-rich sensory protein [Listeria]